MVLLDAPSFEAASFGGVLEELEAIDVDGLDASALGGLLVSIGLARGRLDALEAGVLAAFDRLGGPRADGAVDAKAWLAHRTKISHGAARRSVQRATAIAALPALGELLAAGVVSAAHCEAIGSVVPDNLLAGAGELVEAAKTLSPERLRQRAHRFVLDADPDKGASRRERQRGNEKLSFATADNGMGSSYGEWVPERLASIRDAIDLIADDLWRAEHPNRNPKRWDATTLQYRRADALYQLACRVLGSQPLRTPVSAPDPFAVDVEAAAGDDETAAAPCAPGGHGRTDPRSREACDAELTAAARAANRAPKPLALLAIDYQTARGDLAARGICELADGTPVNPDTMRRLLCDAGVIPAVLNSRGEVLDLGRKIHLPTVAQRRAVFLRDRRCQFPGCDRHAKWSDVHHIVWWETGGRSDYDNLLLLCNYHHHLVHEGGWRLHGTAMNFTIYRPDGELFQHVTRGPP